MNRLFDDVFNRFDTACRRSWAHAGLPRGGLAERRGECARQRGLRLGGAPWHRREGRRSLVDNDVLTIRGEKKSESEDQGRRFSEHYYGRFQRSIALPFEVDEEKAQASFKNGVLTVTIPKSATAKDTAKRIAINAESDTKH